MSWLRPVSDPVLLGSQIGSSSAFRAVTEQRGAPVTPVLNCSASIETLTRGSNCIPFAAAVIPSSSLAGVTVDFTGISLGLNFGIVFVAAVLARSVAVVQEIPGGSCPRPCHMWASNPGPLFCPDGLKGGTLGQTVPSAACHVKPFEW
jgi:hypothetical protein